MPSKAALLVAEILLESKRQKVATVELWHLVDVARRLEELGLELDQVSIYRTGTRYYSDAVARIVSNFLQLGVVQQNSPVELTSCGEEELDRMVEREESSNFVQAIRQYIPTLVKKEFTSA